MSKEQQNNQILKIVCFILDVGPHTHIGQKEQSWNVVSKEGSVSETKPCF